jgi:hypothetical protein
MISDVYKLTPMQLGNSNRVKGTGKNVSMNVTKLRINSKHEIRNSKQIQMTKI